MTTIQEFKTAYGLAKRLRIMTQERGGDEDIANALWILMIQKLDEILRELRP